MLLQPHGIASLSKIDGVLRNSASSITNTNQIHWLIIYWMGINRLLYSMELQPIASAQKFNKYYLLILKNCFLNKSCYAIIHTIKFKIYGVHKKKRKNVCIIEHSQLKYAQYLKFQSTRSYLLMNCEIVFEY